jgi:hypothetical protein
MCYTTVPGMVAVMAGIILPVVQQPVRVRGSQYGLTLRVSPQHVVHNSAEHGGCRGWDRIAWW